MASEQTLHYAQSSQADRLKARLALALTFSAGFVDITGMLAIYRVFTAHMTGDTVHLAQQLVQGHWNEAGVMAVVLFSFISGSLAGRSIIEVGSRKQLGRIASLTLSLEALFLLTVIATGSSGLTPQTLGHGRDVYLSLALLAGAMGLQTATLTRIGPLTVHTTFVTGMLNKFCQLVSHAIFHSYDVVKADTEHIEQMRRNRRQTIRQAGFIASIWLLYLTGAACGTLGTQQWGVRALYVPFGILLAAISVASSRPLAIAEEREQTER